MAEYLLAYNGGKTPESEEEGAKVMAAWGEWMGGLGDRFLDPGAPVGAPTAIAGDGSVTDDATPNLTGYGIIQADSMQAAVAAAKGCPILTDGGTVEVYEKLPM